MSEEGDDSLEKGEDSADLVEFLAKAIVSQPEEVNVIIEDDGDLIELETADNDRGRVIGRQGRVAKALRAILNATADGDGTRLDIVD
jgi:predicted RNA-binding protein YlqC (UPF0109 family)